jgi:hypothetical protein
MINPKLTKISNWLYVEGLLENIDFIKVHLVKL